MQKFFTLFVALPLFLMSCNKETDLFNTHTNSSPTKEILPRKTKYLSFASRQDFNLYIKQIKQGGDALRSAHTYARHIPKGFKSIASLREEQLRSISENSASSSYISDIDTEMTAEEFALFRAEELILDSALRFALDTTLRLEIADTIYAVTEVGTFIAPSAQEEKLNQTIDDFRIINQTTDLLTPIVPTNIVPTNSNTDNFAKVSTEKRISKLTDDLTKLQPSQVMTIDNSVSYIDSYGAIQNTYHNSQPMIDYVPLIYAHQEPQIPEFHKNYNVDTYAWKEKTFVGKMLGKVFGHNISKENYFDKKNRVQLKVYDVNLGFFTSTGITARLQYRKRFLGIKVWKEAVAEKMVIGFNQFHAETTDKAIGFAPQNPLAINTLNGFQATVNGKVSDFVSNIYKNIDFIDDWAHEIAAIVPSIRVGKFDIINPTKAYEFLYNAPRKEIISMLNKNIDQMAISPLRKNALKEAPRMGFFPDGSGKSQVYAIGVSEYTNIKEKKIKLNLAFGISFSRSNGKNSISPFVPKEVKLKAFDVFVSVNKNGIWKGIRLTHNI